MTAPTADAFAALARSSPERWTTLRFTRRASSSSPVRAWLRRPDRLRVEDLEGRLLRVVHERPGPGRPDAPMFENYTWVAMLDPVELADGVDPGSGAAAAGARTSGVVEVAHAGRPAWEAVLAPTAAYQPRCSCCSLLRSREVDERLLSGGGPGALLGAYPTATRVRLDVATGVCVLVEDLDGTSPGVRLEVGIEAVDEPMPDDLFPGS